MKTFVWSKACFLHDIFYLVTCCKKNPKILMIRRMMFLLPIVVCFIFFRYKEILIILSSFIKKMVNYRWRYLYGFLLPEPLGQLIATVQGHNSNS